MLYEKLNILKQKFFLELVFVLVQKFWPKILFEVQICFGLKPRAYQTGVWHWRPSLVLLTVTLITVVRIHPKVIRPIRTRSGLINHYIHKIIGPKISTLQHRKQKKQYCVFQISLAVSENLSLNSYTAWTYFLQKSLFLYCNG